MHVQNRNELRALCGGTIPEHIEAFFEEASAHYAKVKGGEFRAESMAVLYMQALRDDPEAAVMRAASEEPAVRTEDVPPPPPPDLSTCPFRPGEGVIVKMGDKDRDAVFLAVVQGEHNIGLVKVAPQEQDQAGPGYDPMQKIPLENIRHKD